MISNQLISASTLRYHLHFLGSNEEYLKKIALLCHKTEFEAGDVLLLEGTPATQLCFLLKGEVDIVYKLGDDRNVVADTLVAGDAFGWSAFVEPYRLTATCIGSKKGEYIGIEGEELRKICDEYPEIGYRLALELFKLLRDRLIAMRIQLAASR